MSDLGACAIADVLIEPNTGCHLSHLNLSSNRIADSGVNALSETIRGSITLARPNLSGNAASLQSQTSFVREIETVVFGKGATALLEVNLTNMNLTDINSFQLVDSEKFALRSHDNFTKLKVGGSLQDSSSLGFGEQQLLLHYAEEMTAVFSWAEDIP